MLDEKKCLEYLNWLGNDVVEVRIFCKSMYAFKDKKRTGFTCFGYYDKEHFSNLVEDVKIYDNCPNVEGIVITIQEIDSALLARANNRIEMDAKTGQTTSMSNVINYTHFPIDIDPDRPSKISSSNKEKDESKDVAGYVANDVFKGFVMAKAMSGNGYHLVIPIKPFPNTPSNIDRWKRVGDVIAKDIIGIKEGIDGDSMVYSNPTLKLYSTTARKGDHTGERPHRQSIVKLPENIKRYDFERIEELILKFEDKNRYVPKQVFNDSSKNQGNGKYADLKEFLDKNNIEYDNPKNTSDGIVYPMTCVFEESHGKDSFAIQKPDGRWGWKCYHDSCSQFNWHDFRNVVAPKQLSESKPQGFVNTTTLEVEDIDNTSSENFERIVFPDECMRGAPEFLAAACEHRKDIKKEFIHAVVFNTMGSILGRRLYLQDDPPVFPNLYTVIVGPTGSAQKSTVTKLGKIVMKQADSNVVRQTALATAEGLINLFVFPNRLYPGCNIPEDYSEFFADLQDKEKKGIGKFCETFEEEHRSLRSMVEESDPEEGFRVQLVQNELGALLKKSNKGSGSGLRETITELYDMEDMVTSPTKVNPTVAHYPCFSLVGSTTQAWLEKNIDVDDIHGGFINRFSFYMVDDAELEHKKMFHEPVVKDLVAQCSKLLNGMRSELYKKTTVMTVDEEAVEYCEEWHTNTVKELEEITSDIIKASLARFALHCKKYAMLYSVMENEVGDTVIHLPSMELACKLTTYNISVARKLFSEFTVSEVQKIEDVVYAKLRDNGLRGCTPREIANSTRRASIEQVLNALSSLEKAHLIGKTPINFNKGYFRWHAVKDINLDELEENRVQV